METHPETVWVFKKAKGPPAPEALGRETFRLLLKTQTTSECVSKMLPPQMSYPQNESYLGHLVLGITIDYFKSPPGTTFFLNFVPLHEKKLKSLTLGY